VAPVRIEQLFPPALAALQVAEHRTARCKGFGCSPPAATDVTFGQSSSNAQTALIPVAISKTLPNQVLATPAKPRRPWTWCTAAAGAVDPRSRTVGRKLGCPVRTASFAAGRFGLIVDRARSAPVRARTVPAGTGGTAALSGLGKATGGKRSPVASLLTGCSKTLVEQSIAVAVGL